MKKMIVLALAGALTFPQCAARSSLGYTASAPQPQGRVVDRPDVVRKYVERLPIGTVVHLELTSGRKMTAVLMTVEDDAITVKRMTRVPEAAQTIPLEMIVLLEPGGTGSSAAKAVGIGVASGVGAFFAMWLILYLAFAGGD